MSYPFIGSHWFTPGRQGAINKIVLHTIECPCEPGWAKKAADIFAKPTATQVSAHYYVDPTAIIQGVKDSDVAWAAPGVNADGIQVEQAGRAIFSYAEWASPNGRAMCKLTATLLADLSVRHQIPLTFCTAAEMVANPDARGVTTHAEVNRAFHRSTHTDPGSKYPLEFVLETARLLVPVGAAGGVPTPTKEATDMAVMIQVAGNPEIDAFDGIERRRLTPSEFAELGPVLGGTVHMVSQATWDAIPVHSP